MDTILIYYSVNLLKKLYMFMWGRMERCPNNLILPCSTDNEWDQYLNYVHIYLYSPVYRISLSLLE